MQQKDIKPEVVRTARRRCGHLVSQATAEANPALAKEAYQAAKDLPSTTTDRTLQVEGIIMNGPLYDGSALTICYQNQVTRVMKLVEGFELYRILVYQTEMKGEELPGVTSFQLVPISSAEAAMVMPKYPSTLEQLPFLRPAEGIVTFWKQMAAALDALHARGFAHMDVKSANICLTDAGDAVLIDLGSVCRFDERTESTPPYVPSDVDPNPESIRARADVDWWMLAVTLAEKACSLDGKAMRVGVSRRPTKAEVLQHLQHNKLVPAVLAELCIKLGVELPPIAAAPTTAAEPAASS